METIPLGSAAAAVDDEIQRMSQSESKSTQAWLDDVNRSSRRFMLRTN